VEKIPKILLSKKFQVFVSGVLSLLAADKEPGLWTMSDLTIKGIIGLTMTYLGAQGIADHGKEAAKVPGEEAKKV